VKTPSDTGNSPIGFCPGSDEDFTKKKCKTAMVGEGSIQSTRYKKESKAGLVKPGKCAYYSSCFYPNKMIGEIFHWNQNAYLSCQESPLLHPIWK
jgi:hypothetical protein